MPAKQPFPSCCGADIITGFAAPFQPDFSQPMPAPKYDTKRGIYIYPDNPAQLKTEEELHEYMTHLCKYGSASKKEFNRLQVCILNGPQVRQLEGVWLRVLKRMGFEFACQARNQVHNNSQGGSELYLFYRVMGRKEQIHDAPPGWDEIKPEKVRTKATTTVAPVKKLATPKAVNGLIVNEEYDVVSAVERPLEEWE